jgi:hypothetical protein
MRARVSARLLERWRLTMPLALPTLGGLAYLLFYDAPARLIAVNAGALALSLAWTIWGRLPSGHRARLGLATAAAGAMFLPLLFGPEVGGVSRWLGVGLVLLHTGALLLPLVIVLAAGAARFGPSLLALAMVALALQPDAATLAALAAASAVLAATNRSLGYALVAAAGAALAALTFGRGTLEPQLFTEGVLAQVWRSAPVAALTLGSLLFVAAPWLLARAPHLARAEGLALAAMLVTLGAMASIAPFPYPLIGYGASPIIGLALALSAAGKPVHMTIAPSSGVA